MTKYRKALLAAALGYTLFSTSCNVPKHAQSKKLQQLPAAFPNGFDTSENIGRIKREQFFRDPHLQLLIQDVLKSNPDIHIAMQRIRSNAAQFKMTQAAFLPSLSINANSSATKFGKYTMEGVGNYDTNLSGNIDEDQKVATDPTPNYWLGLGTTWELDIWGKLRKMKEAARARYLASEQGMKLVQSMLTAQTTMLYYELVALDNESKIVAENIALQERAVAIVEAQKAGGRATELAVQQFKAQLYNTQSSAYNIVQKRTEVINKLNTLAGRYEGDIVRADKLNILEHFDQSVQVGLPIQILENRPDVLAAQSELKAAKADVGAARAAFFPSLNIAGYAAFNAFNGNLLFSAGSLGYQLFGGVMAPIFQKRQIRTQYNMANASQEQAFFQYQKTVLNAYQEVSNSISAIENTQKSFLLKEKETKALAQGVEISNDLYVTGYASYLEIVAAQKSKLEAELELVILEQNKIFRLVDLYQALGGGWQ